MTTHSTSRVRRYAAVGTAVAIVAGSSAFGLGLGATTASAAEPEAAATTSAASTTSTPSTTPDGSATPGVAPTATATDDPAPTDGTTAPGPADEPNGDTAPAGTDTPADDAASADDAAPGDDAVPADETSTEAGPDATTDAVTPAGTVAVTGTTTIFHTLTASTDGWPADTTFTYQWVFTDRDGTTDVAGAITDTYVVDPQDVDGTVRVRVTGTAPSEDPTTVTSAATAPIADEPTGFRSLAIRDVPTRVGEPFSVSLAAFEGDGLQYFVNDQPGGSSDPGVLPAGVSFSPDGTLSGTPTGAGYTMLWVHVSTSRHPDGGTAMRVFFTAEAAPAVSMRAWVSTSTDDRPYDLWQIAPDGSTRYTSDPQEWYGDPATPLRVPQTAEVNLDVAGTDAFGDTVLFEDGGVRWSSSVAGDSFDTSLSPGALDAGAARLTFAHASQHVITATHGDLSISFTIDVTPTATTVVATKPASGTGELAYTGADATGPIAWALGLLAAGGALLVHRARRRRA